MSCRNFLTSRRCLKMVLLILGILSIASVFINYKRTRSAPDVRSAPTTHPVYTNILAFSSSELFWGELGTCKTYSKGLGKKTRYIDCPSTTLCVTLSADVEYMRSQDAVVFNFFEEPHLSAKMSKLIQLSKKQKYINQTWLFQALESASYLRWSQPRVSSLPVHGIIGYHSSSAIKALNGHYVPGDPLSDPSEEPIQQLMDKKSHMIVWIASNCKDTFWPRMQFVNDLMKHIPVDVYGKCGPLKCLPRMSQKCLRTMESYKFFLALENSECDDYVTEKFWNAVVHGIVPIVYGPRKDYYSKIAPPNSFIYAGDFASVEKLAKHLMYLDKHDEEYVKYLEWRYAGKPADRYIEHCMFCDIPAIMRDVSHGLLEKQPLSETVYYNSCRPQEGGVDYNINVDYSHWTPWK